MFGALYSLFCLVGKVVADIRDGNRTTERKSEAIQNGRPVYYDSKEIPRSIKTNNPVGIRTDYDLGRDVVYDIKTNEIVDVLGKTTEQRWKDYYKDKSDSCKKLAEEFKKEAMEKGYNHYLGCKLNSDGYYKECWRSVVGDYELRQDMEGFIESVELCLTFGYRGCKYVTLEKQNYEIMWKNRLMKEVGAKKLGMTVDEFVDFAKSLRVLI